jgi:Domain of unknown function DUF29
MRRLAWWAVLCPPGIRSWLTNWQRHRCAARALEHRLRDLVVQLLQWQSLPAGGQAGHQRRAIIQEHRRQLTRLLQEHPRLRPYVATVLAGSYADACLDARDATGLPLTTFPQICPWTGEQVLDAAFFPGGEPAL